MAVVVECSYVYEKLDWAVINEYSDKLKQECLMDPGNVNVTVEERDDGTTAYTYTGKVRTPRACCRVRVAPSLYSLRDSIVRPFLAAFYTVVFRPYLVGCFFLTCAQAPMWARVFLPAECQWLDVVSVDLATRERTEQGRNLTRASDGIIIDERSRWCVACSHCPVML